MNQNEKKSLKAQELKKEELENVNGGVGCNKKYAIRRNGSKNGPFARGTEEDEYIY